MPIRDIQLPADLIPLGEMLVDTFHYPDNPEWSIQSDEQAQITDTVKNLARIWPLFRLGSMFSASLLDLFRGCIWEEDGKIVGTTIVQRRGSTNVWIIGTVGVLPAYRRRGFARKLVERGIEIIRARGGQKAWLDVIDGNLPAYQLYESLGFEAYTGHVDFHMLPTEAPSVPELPDGYHLLPLGRFDWQPRFELEKRISPENLLKYEPVEAGRFRQSGIMRLILPLILWAQGTHDEVFQIQDAQGQIVARHGYSVPLREKGLNEIFLQMDSRYPELAPYIIHAMLNRVVTLNPGQRVQLTIPLWMQPAIQAAKAAGFEQRMAFHRMWIEL
jgi:GNAT superfamily N-acetyltransferase